MPRRHDLASAILLLALCGCAAPKPPETVLAIEEEAHHLGDNTVDRFHPPEPGGATFSKTFSVTEAGGNRSPLRADAGGGDAGGATPGGRGAAGQPPRGGVAPGGCDA